MFDALRSAWQRIAIWIAGLFRPEKTSLEVALNVVAKHGIAVRQPGKPAQPVEEQAASGTDDLPVVDRRIAESAEFFEQNWNEFANELDDESVADDWLRAAQQADWPAIVATYSEQLLRLVEGNGTVFGFTEEIRRAVRQAVVGEITKRNAGRPSPTHNGMAEDGGPRHD